MSEFQPQLHETFEAGYAYEEAHVTVSDSTHPWLADVAQPVVGTEIAAFDVAGFNKHEISLLEFVLENKGREFKIGHLLPLLPEELKFDSRRVMASRFIRKLREHQLGAELQTLGGGSSRSFVLGEFVEVLPLDETPRPARKERLQQAIPPHDIDTDKTPYVGPAIIDDDEDWRISALCTQTDPEAFFPEKGGSTREAKRICASCEVKQDCLEYALEGDERFGIWGGLSERERRRLRRMTANSPAD